MVDINRLNELNTKGLAKFANDKVIDEKDAKKLGLNPEEQEDLTKGLSSGKYTIKAGRVVINEGFSEKSVINVAPKKAEKSIFSDPIGWAKENPWKAIGAVASLAVVGVGVAGFAGLTTGLAGSAMASAIPIATTKVGGALLAAAGAIGLFASCTKGDDTYINQNVNIPISVDTSAETEAIIAELRRLRDDIAQLTRENGANLEKIARLIVELTNRTGVALDEIVDLCAGNSVLLGVVVDQLVGGNSLLNDIKNAILAGNEQNAENSAAIIAAIKEVKSSVETVNKSILALPDGIAEKLTPKLQEILAAIQRNGATLSDIKGLLSDLQKLIKEEVIPNQNLNNEENADIINLLKAILAVDVNNGDALVQILKQLKEIGNDLKAIRNGITKLIGQNDKILAYLDKIESNQEKGAELLQAIGQTMLKIKGQLGELTDAQKAYFEKLLKAISENTDAVNANGTKLDDMLALMNLINTNIEEGNQQQREAADKILAKLGELDFNIAAGMGNVVAAVIKSGDKINANVDKVIDLLGKIKTAVDQGNKNAITMGNQLMALLGNIGMSMVDGMDKIYDALLKGNEDLKGLLSQINSNVEEQQKISTAAAEKAQEQAQIIIELLNQFGLEMAAGLSALYAEAVKGNINLESIKSQLEAINAKLDALNSKIDQMSADQKEHFAAVKSYFGTMIANTIKNGEKLDGISAMIDVVVKTINENDAQKLERLDKILAAIAKLNTAVIEGSDKIVQAVANNTLSVEKAIAMIENVAKAVDKVGDKVEANGKKADENAKAIMEKLDNIGFAMSDGFAALLAEAAKGNVTLADIRSLLEKIDGSIKNLSAQQKEYFTQMLAKAVENGSRLDNIAQLIRVVDTDMMTANAEQKAKLDEILKAINTANLNIVGGTEKIVNAVMNAKISVDAAVKLLKELGDAVDKVGGQVEENRKAADENAKAILAKLESIGFAMSEGFSALFDAVEKGRVTLGDIANMVNTIAGKMDKLSAQQKEYFTAMLKQAAANGTKLDGIAALIVKSNELAEKNGAKLDEILKALKDANVNIINGTEAIVAAVVNNTISVNEAVKLIKELGEAVNKVGDKVEANGKKADENAKAILAKLESIGFAMAGGFSALFDAVEKGRLQLADIANMVNTISGKMDKLSAQQKEYFTAMLKQAAANGSKLDGIADLIVISNEIAKTNSAKLDEILAAIKQANVNIVGGTAQIVEAIAKNTMSVNEGIALLKDLAKLVGDIGNKVDKYGKSADENAKAIMENMSAMNFTLHNGFASLLEAADKASGQREEILAAIKNLSADIKGAVNNLSAEQKNYFDKMLALAIQNGDNLDAIKGKLDDIAKLIKEVNNSVNSASAERKAEAQKILDKLEAMHFSFLDGVDKIIDAIVKNGFKAAPFEAILTAIQNNGKIGEGLGVLLNKILEKMDNMNNTNKQGFVDVINAIKDLSNVVSNLSIPGGKDYEQYLKDILAKLDAGNVSVEGLKVEIEGLKALLTTINNNVIKNNDTNEKILKVVEELGAKMAGGFNTVVNAFKDGNAAQLAKLDAILNKLDNMDKNRQKEAADIIAKIVDHNVNVTVDVTGKVTCTCNCNCGAGGTAHEGIVGDLDDLLND